MRPLQKDCEKRDRVEQVSSSAAGYRRVGLAAAVAALAAVLAGPWALAAENPNSRDQKSDKNELESTGIVSPIPLPDPQAVDLLVSQMPGSWQIGDAETMRKYYADDVAVVSAAWEPPLFGWEKYARGYQAQFARTNGGRLDRSNSYAKVLGNNAWVTYQWRFVGQVDGTPTTAFGHTTLVLEKRAGKWMIVLNHTSAVPMSVQAATSSAPSP